MELIDHPIIFFPILILGISMAIYSLYSQWADKDF